MGEIAMDSGGVYLDKDKDVIAATNRLIKYFREFIASDFDRAKVPTAIYGWMATGQVMDKEDAKRRLRELIDIAINRKAGIEDITPKQKQRLDDYRHDARAITDYLTNRIRHTGASNLLRTPEMKIKFPEIDNQPLDEFDSAVLFSPQDKAALDSAGIEKIKLVKELSGIRESMKTVMSGVEKLGFVKRINEIRNILGILGAPDMVEIPLPIRQSTIVDVESYLPILKRFIGDAQLSVMLSSARGDEGQFFIDKLIEVANTLSTMPKTYEQDGKGDEAIVYLHYFKGSADWHITERDMEDEQLQAFGLADLFGDGGELGYISIDELAASGVELDLYWSTKTLKIIRGGGD